MMVRNTTSPSKLEAGINHDFSRSIRILDLLGVRICMDLTALYPSPCIQTLLI